MSYLLPGSDTIRVHTRKDWGARPPGVLQEQPKAPTEAFLHHSDDQNAESIRSLPAQKARMRAIQAFHMDTRGWSDIAYAFLIFQPYGSLRHARIFEGRDWHKVPAAQLGHNTGTLAVCVVGNFAAGDELKRNTRYAIGLLLRSHPAAKALKTVGGHSDVVSTACPGDNIRRWIPRIADAANLKEYA